MTNAVNTVGLTQNAQPQQAQVSISSSSAATSPYANTANSVDTKPLVGSSNTPISPRFVVDPLAGVITEFLSSSGQVQSQIPSAAVVAYLRAGLTASGEVKQTPGSEDQHSKHDNTVLA